MSEDSKNILALLKQPGALFDEAAFPAPHVLVLLGGPSPYFDFPTNWYQSAMRHLDQTVADIGGSLALVASEQTPVWALSSGESLCPRWLIPWDRGRVDEYMAQYAAALAWADAIVVTPDGMDQVNDACATFKPVLLTGGALAKGGLFSFYRRLSQEGRIRPLDQLAEILAKEQA
jgi:mitochondrial fission protein ELM1